MSHRVFILLLVFALPVRSQVDSAEAVSEAPRSPFLPPSVAAEAVSETVVEQDAELQFCGVFGDGDNKRFLIYNVTTRRSSWLRLNQEGPDEVFVESFDPAESTVNVRQGSRPMTLGLQAATLTGGGGGGAAAAVALTGNTREDLVNTVRVNPTPADERRRLEAVAAEVRRRRAARAAAAAGTAAPATP